MSGEDHVVPGYKEPMSREEQDAVRRVEIQNFQVVPDIDDPTYVAKRSDTFQQILADRQGSSCREWEERIGQNHDRGSGTGTISVG